MWTVLCFAMQAVVLLVVPPNAQADTPDFVRLLWCRPVATAMTATQPLRHAALRNNGMLPQRLRAATASTR